MSKVTCSDNLRKVLQQNPLTIGAPKPFGSKRPSVQIKTENNALPFKQAIVPQISQQDLMSNLKSMKKTTTVVNDDRTDEKENNTPEWTKHRLKTSADRKTSSMKNAAQKTSITPKPFAKPKPNPKPAEKPNGLSRDVTVDNERIEAVAEDDSGEKANIRRGSVANSRSYFEDIKRKSASLKPKTKPKPKTSSFLNDCPPPQPSESFPPLPPPEEDFPPPPSTGVICDTHPESEKSGAPHDIDTGMCGDDIYDKVENVITNVREYIAPENNIESKNNDANIYGDVVEETDDGINKSNEMENNNNDDTYGDVVDADYSYGDIMNVAINDEKPSEPPVPIKLPKTFSKLSTLKFIPPYGIDIWLKNAILSNKDRLKTMPTGDISPPLIPRAINNFIAPRQMNVPLHEESKTADEGKSFVTKKSCFFGNF